MSDLARDVEIFEQLVRGLPAALLLVSTRDGLIVAANDDAREQLSAACGVPLASLFDDTADGRAYLRACARSLQPIPGALRRGAASFHVVGWRLAAERDAVMLRVRPRSETSRFALLSQKLEELALEVKQRRAAEHAWKALQGMTAALSAAHTPAELARVALAHCMPAIGARTGAVFRAQGEVVEMLDQVGNPADVVERFRAISLAANLPVPEAIRTGRAVLVGSGAEREERYGLHLPGGAIVALPLRAGARVFGAIGFGFAETRQFTGSEIERMNAFAEVCAQAFERAVMFETATVANRRKDEFLAMLGHELRNPLAPIQTAVELLRTRGPASFVRELDVIERQARQLTILVDDILDVTRIAAGKIALRRRTVALEDTLQRAIDVVAPALERRGHALALDVTPGIVLDADHDRIAQVITNLLENAAKYTPDGGRIRAVLTEADGWAELRVADNGRGIAPSLLSRIFEPFVQDERRGARTPGGLGLGLAIVKGIVDLHGGQVSVHSAGPGTGSEFVVRLPGARRATEPATTGAAVHLRVPARAHRGRVLVVDDNADAAEMLADALAELGYVTRSAPDGPSALRIVGDFIPDIALVDLGMPLMDGFELSRRLREIPSLAAMRLVAITGYGQAQDVRATREAGFDGHLVKPVPFDRIEQTLARLTQPGGSPLTPGDARAT